MYTRQEQSGFCVRVYRERRCIAGLAASFYCSLDRIKESAFGAILAAAGNHSKWRVFVSFLCVMLARILLNYVRALAVVVVEEKKS